jgi:hypothetical protein
VPSSKNKRYLKISEAGGGATSHAVRYLKNQHHLDLDADEQAIPATLTSLFSSVATAATAIVATGLSHLQSVPWESAYGGHYRGMEMSKGLVEEGTYSTTEGLGRQ